MVRASGIPLRVTAFRNLSHFKPGAKADEGVCNKPAKQRKALITFIFRDSFQLRTPQKKNTSVFFSASARSSH